MSRQDADKPREPTSLPQGVVIRQALPSDAESIHALMRPYVMQRLLLSRSQPEIIELTRHGFVAELADADQDGDGDPKIVGFSAVEIYSTKLAELQCLAVHNMFQGSGVGKALVASCVERARDLNVMEVMAISSSENFLLGCGFDFSLPDQKKALFCRLRERSHE